MLHSFGFRFHSGLGSANCTVGPGLCSSGSNSFAYVTVLVAVSFPSPFSATATTLLPLAWDSCWGGGSWFRLSRPCLHRPNKEFQTRVYLCGHCLLLSGTGQGGNSITEIENKQCKKNPIPMYVVSVP